MSGPGPDVVVVHDAGDERGGAAWAAALEGAGWPGAVLHPALPGHGRAPAPRGGAYELVDAAIHVLPVLAGLRPSLPVVLGVGASGWSAQLLALAGRAVGLVLVDGLGGPWQTPAASIGSQRAWMRGIADDPAAVQPAPDGELDPRLRHGIPRQTSPDLAARAAAALAVPVLVIETAASQVPAPDVRELVDRMPRGELVAGAGDPGEVAALSVRWLAGSGLTAATTTPPG